MNQQKRFCRKFKKKLRCEKKNIEFVIIWENYWKHNRNYIEEKFVDVWQ